MEAGDRVRCQCAWHFVKCYVSAGSLLQPDGVALDPAIPQCLLWRRPAEREGGGAGGAVPHVERGASGDWGGGGGKWKWR